MKTIKVFKDKKRYYCSICDKRHYTDSKIGKDHGREINV